VNRRAGAGAAITAGLAAPLGAAWIVARRGRYRRVARRLDGAERAVLAGFFSEALLERVRVAEVERIENPPLATLLRRAGLGLMDLGTVGGMAFGDIVVLAGRKSLGTLFHELVHCVQYERLGVVGFVRAYVRGWLENGRSYWEIPLEREAYELQERFERGERFLVDGEMKVS
jgi:hypothetical protein